MSLREVKKRTAVFEIGLLFGVLAFFLQGCDNLAVNGPCAGVNADDRGCPGYTISTYQSTHPTGKNKYLINASASGDLNGAIKALNDGANVNAKNYDGWTALMLAVSQEHIAIVNLLLEHGANINAMSNDGRTATDIAIKADNKDISALLFTFTPLHLSPSGNLLWQSSSFVRLSPEIRPGNSGGETMRTLVKWAIFHTMRVLTSHPPKKPSPPPSLSQGPYESTTSFRGRVEKAKRDYASKIKAYNVDVANYNQKVKNIQTKVTSQIPLFEKKAFLTVFGNPTIEKTIYNPDTKIFRILVKGDGRLAPNDPFTLVLKTPIPNDQAQDFDTRLKSASPVLEVRIGSGTVEVEGGSVNVASQNYAALPAEEGSSFQLAKVDLDRVFAKSKIASPGNADESSFPIETLKLSSDPRLRKEAKKLERLQKEQATQEEIAATKRRIAELEKKLGQGTEGSEAVSSRIDAPSFHLSSNRNAYALVIGVEHYAPGIPPAEFADHDAKAVYRYFLAMGVPPTHIRRLTDATATRSRIRGALTWLGRNAAAGSTVYVYYSGHGSPDRHGSAYLVPSDGDPSDLSDTGYDLGQFYKRLGSLPARRIIVALDACFTGQGKRSVLGNGVRPLVTKIREGALPESGKILVLTAAKSDQEAGVIRKEGHGLFTYYLLKGLDEGAVRNGHVTVSRLYGYVKQKVERKASLDNRTQTPELEPRRGNSETSVQLR